MTRGASTMPIPVISEGVVNEDGAATIMARVTAGTGASNGGYGKEYTKKRAIEALVEIATRCSVYDDRCTDGRVSGQ